MFGENLKTLRKQKGFSQEELAARLHVVRQTISKWEKNLSVPDADTLIRLAEILEVPVSEMLGAKIENENTASDVAEQLSRINEQLAIKNRRSRRIWKIVAIILAAMVFINILIAMLFSVPNFNEGIQSNQPEITGQTQIIEEWIAKPAEPVNGQDERRMAAGALIEEGCIIDQDDSDHDMMDDLRVGRETLPSLL